MRSFVSFESALGKDTSPPGLEIARILREDLREQEIHCDEPEGNEGYGWRIDCKAGGVSLFVLVQLTNDRLGRECWLGILAPTFGLWSRLRRRGQVAQRRLCDALHKGLASEGRFREIRWYTREEWEQHPENAVAQP